MKLLTCFAFYLLMHSAVYGIDRNDFDLNMHFIKRYRSQEQKELYDVLEAINRALVYLQSVTDIINLDGVLGIRFVQTRIEAYLVRYATQIPSQMIDILNSIHELACQVGDAGASTVAMKTPHYYEVAGFMMKPSTLKKYFLRRPLKTSEPWAYDPNLDNWREEDCDICMNQIGGGDSQSRCTLSEMCWKNATTTQMSGYSLAHQVLYLLIGINNNCGSLMDAHIARLDSQITVNGMLERLCGRIAKEIKYIESMNYPSALRDLFMEQVGICGYAGFLSVCQPNYLQQILSWQATNGCFHKFNEEVIAPENFDPNRYGHYRRKRSEQILSPGPEACLSHRTSVALFALSSFMTLYIEALYGDSDPLNTET
ncbi:UPF0764 protein C16orf89 homolog [Clonorchis sinensis]|uniref:UPF0764 protein C16orf89 homolog n=1 Tax=Clonorchis sinensis TaxID=79923 RepID=G7Y4U7_CLOSI|nr:UPF0764 protein C16orf89 homolog [Clonorchis sinensis]